MKRIGMGLTALMTAGFIVSACGPVDNLDSQGSDLGKNILISRDSADVLDPDIIKNIVIDTINPNDWASVVVNSQPDVIYTMLNHKDSYSIDFMQIRHDGQRATEVGYDVYYPVVVESSSFYASCPDTTRETYWSTECSTISTAVNVINTNNSRAQTRGYKTEKAVGSAESYTNVMNNLSCAGLKVWGRVGHGYTGGLQLTGGYNLTGFSGVSLSNKGIYANSCLAFNNPFKSKVTGAGAKWYISGITNLSIGSSEATFNCWWNKAKDQAEVCTTLNGCVQSGAGQHGCYGQGSIVAAPGGVNPTPTPEPTPTPTPDPNDPNSCVGNCGNKAPGGCWCDSSCAQYGDCCADKAQACDGVQPTPTPTPNPTPTPTPTPNPTPTPTPDPTDPNSCVGNCGKKAPGGCWCDSSCQSYGDCCSDKQQVCG